jgi:hypothetical protein
MERINIDRVLRALEACDVAHGLLDLSDGYRLVVVGRGGHALGPFDASGASVLWLNPAAWESNQAYSQFVEEGQWNVGGERLWIAPEIRFTAQDRSDFWGKYILPADMDPGNYQLEANGQTVSLVGDAALPRFNPVEGDIRLHIERSYRPAPNPLRHLKTFAKLSDGVAYAGYSHDVTIDVRSPADEAAVEAWTLAQLVPDGTLIIPATPGVEFEDYYEYEPIDDKHLQITSGAALLAVTGRRRYKIGFRSPHLTGRVGFFKRCPGGQAELIVRNFFNDPSSDYVEEPAHRVGCRGLSVHVYNDGGVFGGFGELECNGRTIGGETGASGSDEFAFWFFTGAEAKVRRVSEVLLGNWGQASPS